MIRNLLLAVLGYVVAAIISGQVLMRGQGDTPQISIRYGLLYVAQGGGITDMIGYFRLREFPFSPALAALIQIIVAAGVFCRLQFGQK